MNYFQSNVLIFSPANHNNISDERDYYRIWEKQRGNQFWSDGGYYHIIQPGIRNHYAGPDYIHAVIQYPNGEILKGDVEIHTSVSDWYRHKYHMNRHYENVILHVINSGRVLPVFTGQTTHIPTIKLGNTILPLQTRECENLSHTLHWDQFMDWISVFSNQRWEYLQSIFGNEPSKIQHRILSFMDIKTNRPLVQKTIDYYCSLPSEIDIETNCTLVTQYAEKLPWIMGGKRPVSHPLKRLPYLIYIAVNFNNIINSLFSFKVGEFRKYLVNNTRFSEPIPGKSFLIEILGNILLPLSQQITSKNLYSIWFHLPVQPYGKYARHLQIMGYEHRMNFGIQQGLIEINQQLCGMDLCHICPFTQIESRGYN